MQCSLEGTICACGSPADVAICPEEWCDLITYIRKSNRIGQSSRECALTQINNVNKFQGKMAISAYRCLRNKASSILK